VALGEVVCVGRIVKECLTACGIDLVVVGEVSCVMDAVKEGLTARSLHSGVLDGVNWASRTVKQGPGVAILSWQEGPAKTSLRDLVQRSQNSTP
jgi:hypothetical protein